MLILEIVLASKDIPVLILEMIIILKKVPIPMQILETVPISSEPHNLRAHICLKKTTKPDDVFN